MSEHDQLPEHHRAYVRARANVLSCAERSTAALDALVARGVTDAEELPLRERRYLAARGGMLRRGEDPASLDGYVEGVLDDGEAQVPVGHGPDHADAAADDLIVGGVVYSATEWESDGEGGVRRTGGDHTQPEAAREPWMRRPAQHDRPRFPGPCGWPACSVARCTGRRHPAVQPHTTRSTGNHPEPTKWGAAGRRGTGEDTNRHASKDRSSGDERHA